MAIPLGTNDLKIFRRHLTNCSRYQNGSEKPFTPRPLSPKDKKADSCECPIWCLGYLAKETHVRNGRLKPRRVFVSLGTNEWAAAETEVANLYKTGALPAIQPKPSTVEIDKTAVTVIHAGKRYLESRGDGASDDPIEKDTLVKYDCLIKQRFLPYCEKNSIVNIRAFEDRDVCNQFIESWRQIRRNKGAFLGIGTRMVEKQRFSTFLNWCVENGWMARNGAKSGKRKRKGKQRRAEEGRVRYGLELYEYEQMLAAPDSTALTPQENQETRVATELMRWSGLRISDCQKFNDSEIVRNENHDGWNADFIQKKTGMPCVTPLPDHVKSQLTALPGRVENGKKYFFTCSYTALRERVDTLAARAQKDKPFAHGFSPHSLRHYAASRTMPRRSERRSSEAHKSVAAAAHAAS